MSAPSAYTAYVEATTDADPGGVGSVESAFTAYLSATTDGDPAGSTASAWSGYLQVTTDTAAGFQVRKMRRAGAWVDTTGRQFRRNGTWV
jgi:hypothetical protein